MEPKFIIFFIFLLFGIPAAITILRTSVRLQKFALFVAVFFIPFIYSTGINFFTVETYRGTSRGYEILASDMAIWSLGGALILNWSWKNFKLMPTGTSMYFIYLFFAIVSLANADSLLFGGYEIWKMVLMYVYFAVVYNAIIRFQGVKIILYAFAAVLILTFFHMAIQKYLLGVYQPSGMFPHRNSTGMFANLVAPIFLSVIYNTKLPKREFYLFAFAYACSGLIVMFTLSRGAIAMFPFASFIVVAASFIFQKPNPRKIKITAAMFILGALAFAKGASTVIDRFENAPKTSTEGRIYLAKTALNMANDKFFGIGVNNWGIKINYPYTYTAGTGMPEVEEDEKHGLVETIYLLVAAECGWIGFLALVSWLGYYYWVNLKNVFRYKNSAAQYIPIGILGGLSAVYGQSILEWVLKQSTNFYQLMIIFAIIAAMCDIHKRFAAGKKTR